MFRSPFRDVPLVQRSIFSHLLTPDAPGRLGGFPAAAPAFIDADSGKVVSRADLRDLALQFAHSLLRLPPPLAHASSPSRTVLILSPNNIVWPILVHGIAAAGFCVTLANTASTPAELAYQYTNAAAHLLFVHPSLVSVAKDALISLGCTESDIRARLVLVTCCWLTGVPDPEATLYTPLEALFGHGALAHEASFDGERSNETIILCYSSGTTGTPKGVETTHHNLTSLIEMMRPVWPKTVPCLTPALPTSTDSLQPDVLFGPLPYHHIYGLVKLLLFPLSLGIPSIVSSGFDPIRFLETIARYRASILLVVPPILVVLARYPAIERYNLASVHTVYCAAAPSGPELVATVRNRLREVGAKVAISQAYGLTETSPTLTLLHPDDANTRIGSVGRVLPNLEVQLVQQDAGEVITDIANAGEIWVRGPTVMKGYLNNPSATAAAITPDGWFKTGDIATVDAEGFITIIDRRKELIKYKGFQVPPAELEALLLQHADVADAAVIGVEIKEEATELPRAYIVPARPVPPSDEAAFALGVQAWAADRVAAHKKLRGGIIIIDQIPKSASGKILRRQLRERCQDEVGHGQLVIRAKL